MSEVVKYTDSVFGTAHVLGIEVSSFQGVLIRWFEEFR